MKQAITRNFLLIVLALAVVFAFAMKATIFQQPAAATKPAPQLSPQVAAYWLPGRGELNRYRLQQAQHGRLNPGEALLVFVTEDFRTDTQVKADTTPEGGRNAISVLKTNLTRRFATGLYANSLQTSVFTPINNPLFPNTLKVSTSAQDGEGHSYLQVNYRSNAYQVTGKSYLEKEVDETYTLEKTLFEDELWGRIRLAPDQLPVGETRLIPGTMSARLRHTRLEPLAAKTRLADYAGVLFPGKLLRSYTIEYPSDDRTLLIVFERTFPHKIVGWEETYRSQDALLTSRAVLTKTIQNDYLKHNAPADSSLRADPMNR